MNIVFFASGGPGNLYAAFQAQNHCSELAVKLVIADRLNTPSAFLARARGCPVLEFDFDSFVPSTAARKSEEFHDHILEAILDIERSQGAPFHLAVLAYRRIISGKLFDYFEDRAINQHPADLTLLNADGERRYTGIGGLGRSIKDDMAYTRTSTILVGKRVDAGEILCQGPRMVVQCGPFHDRNTIVAIEQAQKAHSDWPSLVFALQGIAQNRFTFVPDQRHPDGSRIVAFDGNPMPYGGVAL